MFNTQGNVFSKDGNWTQHPIKRRHDDSYEIIYNGLPFHVPAEAEEWQAVYAIVNEYATEHPDQVTDEPAPPVPTEAELLARAKTIKTAEFDRVMADIDAELIRSTTDLVAAMLTPATLAADEDGSSAIKAEELEQSKVFFVTLRQVQARNRALREQMEAAQTVEAVQAIEPIIPDLPALAAVF